MSAIEDAINRHRQQLAANEQAALRELMQSFDAVRARLLARVQQLVAEIDERQERDQVVPGSLLLRQDRAVALLAQVERELAEVAARAVQPVSGGQASAVELGSAHALTLLETVAAATIGTIETSFNRINRPALEAMVGRMSDGAPLQTWLAQFGPETAASLREALQSAAALGTNPRGVARVLARQLDIAETRLLTLARTEILGSYRDAALERYRQNGDLLDGWFWVAARQTRTCLACFPGDTEVSGPRAEKAFSRHYAGWVVVIKTASGKELTATPNHPILTPSGWVRAEFVKPGDDVICYAGRKRTPLAIQVGDEHVPPTIADVSESLSVVSAEMPCAAPDFHGDGIGSDVYVIRSDSLLRNDFDSTIVQPSSDLPLGVRVPCVEPRRSSSLPLDGCGASLFPSSHMGTGVVSPMLLSGRKRNSLTAKMVYLFVRSQRCIGDLQACVDRLTRNRERFSNTKDRFAGLIPTRDIGILHPQFAVSINPVRESVHRIRVRARSNQTTFSQDVKQCGVIDPADARGVFGTRAGEILADCSVHVSSDARTPLGHVNARFPKDLADDPVSLLKSLHQRDDVLAGEVATDHVVSVERKWFSGHVFNLQTTEGWYTANGIIAHNCLALDGRAFPLTEPFQRSHVNCRCGAVPKFKGEGRLPIETAREWFGGQPEALQRSMVPPTAWEDFRAGRLTLDDFVHLDRDDRWGDRYRQASVAQARANAYLRTQITRAA